MECDIERAVALTVSPANGVSSDGRSDLAVFRPSDGGWQVRCSSVGYAVNQWAYYQWGLSTDTPLMGK